MPTELSPENPEGIPKIPLSLTGHTSSPTPPLLFPRPSSQGLHSIQRSANTDISTKDLQFNGDSKNEHSTGIKYSQTSQDFYVIESSRRGKVDIITHPRPPRPSSQHSTGIKYSQNQQRSTTGYKKYECPQEGCCQTYSRASDL